MGFYLNIVIVNGYLVKDLKTTQSEYGLLGSCTLSVKSKSYNSDRDEWRLHSHLVRVNLTARQVKYYKQYLKKGTYIIVTGELITSSFKDSQTGEHRLFTKIQAKTLTVTEKMFNKLALEKEVWSYKEDGNKSSDGLDYLRKAYKKSKKKEELNNGANNTK